MQTVSSLRIDQYADALLALGKATGAVQRLEKDLSAVLDLAANSEELRRFTADMRVDSAGKEHALAEILGGRVHPVMLKFLMLLAGQNDWRYIEAVGLSFFRKIAQQDNKAVGEVFSPVLLPPEKVAAIEHEAARILGREVRLQARLDSTMLGGVLLRVGDFVIDDTVDTRLEAIRSSLMG